jgi:Cytochrome b5-like Heme/Steroid binding domain
MIHPTTMSDPENMDGGWVPTVMKTDPKSCDVQLDRPASTAAIKRPLQNQNSRKCISILVGMVLLGGLVAAIIILVKFMQEGDIHFMQNGATGAIGSSSAIVITLKELALHASEDDCWVALYGDVCDLTGYARRHPHGSKDITELAGTDGTAKYAQKHPASLLRAVKNTMVGRLSTATKSNQQEINYSQNWNDPND